MRYADAIEAKKVPAPVEIKTDPFMSFIAWLEKQRADRIYDYFACDGTCLFDQFVLAVTGKVSRPGFSHWTICGGYRNYAAIAKAQPWTYGAAVARARKLAAALPD